jgi:hypothetical protein
MHFQSRMYAAKGRTKKYGYTRLRAEERRDLRLLRHLIDVAQRGISLNNIVYRLPNHFGRSDAFEEGIGGFDLTSGRAWRLQLPVQLRYRKSQNFLEYLACMTQLICILFESDWRPGDCFLCIGDNTSALGWIRKSKFRPDKDPEQASHLALARHITHLLAELDVTQGGKWLPGVDNGVADALSRRHELNDSDLTDYIVSSFPTQTPIGFHIKALPPRITSWALYWVQHSYETKESPPELRPKGKCGGDVGLNSCTTVNSKMTSSYDSSPPTNANCSSAPSHTKSETVRGHDLRKDMITWLREHAVPRSTTFVRPSSQPVGTIPAKTRTATMHSFYNDKSAGTRTTTQRNNRKKRSRLACSKN